MKPFNAMIATVSLVSSYEACVCLSSSGVHKAATQDCCRQAGGSLQRPECPARQVIQHLDIFASCCRSYGARLDCRCLGGCHHAGLDTRQEGIAQERKHNPPPIEEEVSAIRVRHQE
jgi:hypothetical protein